MGLTDIFWLFLILAAVHPLIKQRMLEAARQRLIAKIEKERGSRLILLVHRQETMSILGFPVFRYIDVNDSEAVIRAIHMTDPEMPLDIVLHTPGGLVLPSVQIAKAINRHNGKVTVFVPHYAMSGGTLIALAADEIVMSEHAVLGPVDPQLGQYAAASILRVVEQKSIDKIDDETLILADQAGKAMAQVKASVKDLLVDNLTEERAEEVAAALTGGRWTHDYPITFEEASTLIGLPVKGDIPQDFLQLMGLFPQPTRRQSSVEYLPVPRKRTPAQSD
ncbi:ATP-dependent Clp protease proteolytic subunit [Candidatus Fermentibacteria bacterium]|nr:ATP-dependent Clp protease proteolytic subunit [Candidatus Fermentibacteria bacterium]